MKTVLKWLSAIVAMVGLSSGSAYLAFEASPDPIILVDQVTVKVPVDREYAVITCIAVYKEYVVEFEEGAEEALDKTDLMYLVYLKYDISTGDNWSEVGIYVTVDGGLRRLTVRVPGDNLTVITKPITQPEQPANPATEEEF